MRERVLHETHTAAGSQPGEPRRVAKSREKTMLMPRILVADDEDFIALLIAELLEDLEYEVKTVYNGRDAIRALASDPPDLVISDIMMPHATGMEIIAAMREREETRHTPVILMSAAGEPRLPDDRVAFIPKPFNLRHVLDMVGQLLGSGAVAGRAQPV
jgi:CheY-like chemotaxis protein